MVPYLFIFSLVASVVHGGTNCGTYTASDGTMYNLTLLTKPPAVGYSIPSGSFTYFFNLCDYYTTPQTQTYCYAPAPAYQITVTQLCYLLGALPPVIKDGINGPDTGVTVVYTNQEDRCQFGTIPRIMNINVKCDHKIEAVVSITEPSTCVYDITMTSPHACPVIPEKPMKDRISGGTIFLIVFLVVVVLYLVGGVVFRYKFQEVEPGVDLIPNLGLWTALPGLVKDGCVFTYTKISSLVRGNSL